MARQYHYIGCFVRPDELFRHMDVISTGHLDRVIQTPHITFEYKPETVDESLFGNRIGVQIMGYGNDGENEGVRVALHSEDKRLRKMIQNIPTPHITVTVSNTGKSVNTRFLEFYPISSFEIEGVFGGYDSEGNIITEILRN